MSSVKTRKLDISTILAVDKAQTGSGATGPPVVGSAIIREIQPAGVGSSVSFSSNVRTLRQMNDIQFNSLNITLSGTPNWTITIPTEGTYSFYARSMFLIYRPSSNYLIGANSKLFIRNETLGLDNWIVGDSIINQYRLVDDSGPNNICVELNGIQTITTPTTISLRQVCNANAGIPVLTGGGAVNILSSPEVYATLQITRIA